MDHSLHKGCTSTVKLHEHRCFKLLIIQLLVKHVVKATNKENIEVLHYWFFVREIHHYNMVGVAVATVISTMHEKSCIDSHNARKF